MIQRVQSLYLLLASMVIILVGVLKIATISNAEQSADIYYWSILGSEGTGAWVLTFTVPLAALSFILTISQYKNRILQLKLSKLNYLLLAGVVIGIYLTTGSVVDSIGEGALQTRGMASYLPLGGLALNFLAIRAIMKDEKLIKSVDRLR